MEQAALEVRETVDVRVGRAVQAAEPPNHEARAEGRLAGDLDLPPLGFLAPPRAGHLGAKAQVFTYLKAVGAILEIRADLTVAAYRCDQYGLGANEYE